MACLYDRKIEWAGGTTSLLGRHETPNFEHGTRLRAALQEALVAAFQDRAGHMPSNLMGEDGRAWIAQGWKIRFPVTGPHNRPQGSLVKQLSSLKTTAASRSRANWRSKDQQADEAVLSCIFRARVCLVCTSRVVLQLEVHIANGVQSLVSRPTHPASRGTSLAC